MAQPLRSSEAGFARRRLVCRARSASGSRRVGVGPWEGQSPSHARYRRRGFASSQMIWRPLTSLPVSAAMIRSASAGATFT
jgi:hypothetical protein